MLDRLLLGVCQDQLDETRTMRVALTEWEGRVSPVLDTARSVTVVDTENGRPVSRRNEVLAGSTAQENIRRLRDLGVALLVCGAVSRPLAEVIQSWGIELVPFVAGGIDEVLEAVLSNRIPDPAFSMPGCRCGRGRRARVRRGRCGERRG